MRESKPTIKLLKKLYKKMTEDIDCRPFYQTFPVIETWFKSFIEDEETDRKHYYHHTESIVDIQADKTYYFNYNKFMIVIKDYMNHTVGYIKDLK